MKECNQKKKYNKPGLRAIELAAEEVLGAGCKTTKGDFSVGSSPCMANSCVKKGS